MMMEIHIDEPVQVWLRAMPTGELLPTSLVWRDKTRYVESVGRRWEERVAGKTLRCYLIRTVDNQTFDLRWDPAGDVWTLHRGWMENIA